MTLEERVSRLEQQVHAGDATVRRKQSRLMELDAQVASTMRTLAALQCERQAVQAELDAWSKQTA